MTGDDGVIKIDTNVGTELTTRSEARALTKNGAVKQTPRAEKFLRVQSRHESCCKTVLVSEISVFFFGGVYFLMLIEIADAKRPGPSENLSGTDP